MSEHTKTPWSWQLPNGKFISNEPFKLYCEDYGTTSSAITAEGKVVCIVPEADNGDWDDGERHANLLHIVKAVNYHERLVEALGKCFKIMSDGCGTWTIEDQREARTILQELEGEL